MANARTKEQIEKEGKNLYIIKYLTPTGKSTYPHGSETYRFPTREQAEAYNEDKEIEGNVVESKGLPIGKPVSYEGGEFEIGGAE